MQYKWQLIIKLDNNNNNQMVISLLIIKMLNELTRFLKRKISPINDETITNP